MAKKMKKLNKIRTSHIWANPRNCVACWKCIDTCPEQVIGKVSFLWHKHVIIKNSADCIGCKKCIQVCSSGVFSEEIPDLLKIILAKKGINIQDVL
jgi:NAD-dependent dihydropyrimidine dehydrogenase PreA subunit